VSYEVLLKASAEHELERLTARVHDRVVKRLLLLANEPRPAGSKKLHGLEACRVRVGDYRVLYEIDDRRRIVTIYSVGHRREVYR
jgi:mRNA interferase RelE/StbE